jgi:cytochrome c556
LGGAGVVAMLASLMFSSGVAADPAEPAALGARVHGFRELGAAFKTVNDELKSGTPQVMMLQLSARQIRDASRAQTGWFPADSAPRPGLKTAAKPEIWSQPAQFKKAQDDFAAQAAAFYRVAATGDVAAMRIQAKPLGAACAACHRSFRIETR